MTVWRNWLATALMPLALLGSTGSALEAESFGPETTAPAYSQWLDDVHYIITPNEREAFRRLQNDRERDLFIQSFWQHRDPTPGTPGNEFRDEHLRRLQYVEKAYGRKKFNQPGWRTDRGKVYIILGPPQGIQRYNSYTKVYPLEVWHYQIEPRAGLPPAFNLIFYDRGNTGDFTLYSPIADGPQRLLIGYQGNPSDVSAAFQELADFDTFLAKTAISLIPDEESATGTPSMSSDFLLRNIEESPRKTVEDLYARKFLEYRGRVEVDYSLNFIMSRNLSQLLRRSDGNGEFHYLIQLDRLSVDQLDDRYTSSLEVVGSLIDRQGRTVYQFDKAFPISLEERQLQAVRDSGLAIADRLPVIPGDFHLSILVKNNISREFTAYETDISLPPPSAKLYVTSPLLAYEVQERSAAVRPPFTIDGRGYAIDPENRFSRQNRMAVFSQICGASAELRRSGRIRVDIRGEKGATWSRSAPLSEPGPDPLPMYMEIPLQEFPADYYTLVFSVADAGGATLLQSERRFTVSPLPVIPRPQVLAKTSALNPEAMDLYVLGTQYRNAGRPDLALPLLEKARHLAPQVKEFALGLARLCAEQNQWTRIEPLLAPHADSPRPDPQIGFMLGMAELKTGRFEAAGERFRGLIASQGPTVETLNALAACCLHLGRTDEARRAWRESLSLDPGQEAVRKALQGVKQ